MGKKTLALLAALIVLAALASCRPTAAWGGLDNGTVGQAL